MGGNSLKNTFASLMNLVYPKRKELSVFKANLFLDEIYICFTGKPASQKFFSPSENIAESLTSPCKEHPVKNALYTEKWGL